MSARKENNDKMLKPNILVVDDEEAVAAVLKYNLNKEGYNVRIAFDGAEALELIEYYSPDLILLDWMLPSMTGIELLTKLRSSSKARNTPVIMISSRGEELDKVVGLEKGADDYIVKPFSALELVARIRAVFKRMRPVFTEETLTFHDIVMDLSSHVVSRNGKEISLAPIEFQILQIFMESPGRVLSREVLIDKIWGADIYIGSRTVDVHITRLRKALLSASVDGIDVIRTIRLAGYTLRIDNFGKPMNEEEK